MIIKRRYDLEKGTVLENMDRCIKLTSDFDYHTGTYSYVEMIANDDGNLIEGKMKGLVTASDLIGYEVC